MKLIIDNMLSRKLAWLLRREGHDAAHVLDLPDAGLSKDRSIASVADAEQRIVVTKDWDFHNLHTGTGSPAQLLAIRLGNISDRDLWTILYARLPQIEQGFTQANVVEVHDSVLVFSTPRQ